MDLFVEFLVKAAGGVVAAVATLYAARLLRWWQFKKSIDRLCGVYHVSKNGARISDETVIVSRFQGNVILFVCEGSHDLPACVVTGATRKAVDPRVARVAP